MVGIDILEVARIDNSEAFINKIAREGEIEYIKRSPCQSLQAQRLTALFCVKEAVMKALEMGKNSGVVFKDIELCHEDSGKPFVKLYGRALEKYTTHFAGKKIEISLSHTETFATAIAMLI